MTQLVTMDITDREGVMSETLASSEAGTEARSTRRRAAALLSGTAPIWAGVVLLGVARAVIGFAWRQVALISEVWQQVAYLLSGGFVGVVLALAGLTAISASVRHRDAAEQSRQLDELREILVELRRAVVDEEPE
jgi:hypothetical protein